ncbi:hypothetical protein T492DRAFT_836167 [Pavlovales sp. CCMP2436]|nr:hypothetical protein T492DRAFT_836167 [Pavlovales sp. CCMP2436]
MARVMSKLVMLTFAAAAAFLAMEVPSDWQLVQFSDSQLAVGKMVLSETRAPIWSFAVVYSLTDGEANVTASGKPVPMRCVCNQIKTRDMCVCVGGPFHAAACRLEKTLASAETRSGIVDWPAAVYGVWTEMLKLVAGADFCQGLAHPAAAAKLEHDVTWGSGLAVSFNETLYDVSGARIPGYFAQTGCAVLVNESSGLGQRLVRRVSPPTSPSAPAPGPDACAPCAEPEEVGPRQARPGIQGDLPICDACNGCWNTLRTSASRPIPDKVASKARTSRLTDKGKELQAAGRLDALKGENKQLRKEINQVKKDIETGGVKYVHAGLSPMMAELRTFSGPTLLKAWQLLQGGASKYDWLRESGMISLPSARLLQMKFGSNEITGHERERFEKLANRTPCDAPRRVTTARATWPLTPPDSPRDPSAGVPDPTRAQAHLQRQERWGSLSRDEMKIKEGIVLRRLAGDEWAMVGLVAHAPDEDVDQSLTKIVAAESVLHYVWTSAGRSGKLDKSTGKKAREYFNVASFGVATLTASQLTVFDREVMSELHSVAKDACESALMDVAGLPTSGACEFVACFCPHPFVVGKTLGYMMDATHGDKRAAGVARHSRESWPASAPPGKCLWFPSRGTGPGAHVYWEGAEAMFDYDKSHTTKVYPSITSESVRPSNIEAMRVSVARATSASQSILHARSSSPAQIGPTAPNPLRAVGRQRSTSARCTSRAASSAASAAAFLDGFSARGWPVHATTEPGAVAGANRSSRLRSTLAAAALAFALAFQTTLPASLSSAHAALRSFSSGAASGAPLALASAL